MTNINTKHNSHLSSFFYLFLISQILATAPPTIDNRITITSPLTINTTLVSQQQKFELGFFTPGGPNSDKWYIGIWYKEIKETTIVWVANRANPVILNNSSSYSFPPMMKITKNGRIVIDDGRGIHVWWSDDSEFPLNSTPTFFAKLLDTGNFLLVSLEKNQEKIMWQSFNYPTDTLLPGMKLGWDSKTGLNRNITSWKSPFDPTPGNYTFKLHVNGLPEAYLTNRDVVFYRSGPWNGVGFSGVPEMKPTDIITFEFQMNKDQVYYTFEVLDKKICSRLLVKHNGFLERYTWIPTSQIWNKFWYAPKDQCDFYEECGISGICNANLSPKNQVAWDLRDGSDGCVRYHELNCDTDVFNKLKNMKLPQSSSSFVDTKMNLEECEKMCRYNCSCTAYTTANITGVGSGCVIWTKELVDMRQYSVAEGGQILYVRVAASDAAKSGNVGSEDGSGKTKRIAMATGITAGVVLVLIGVASICLLSKKKKLLQGPIRKKMDQRGSIERSQDLLVNTAIIPSKREISGEAVADEFELPLFDLSTIAVATEDFSDINKLGQGGFGCVYKGIIDEDQEIAVKRLSKNSGQGIEEFKNELRLIARLQHRNLVRLLGCCVEMEEKMLIYEYMENKSLDSILFNKQNSSLLDWQRRFSIICGIARGLLYLHQDSRFRIIHRDLKASNILLDKEMNPKISDFGMARIFGGDETEGNTKRVVGTYGYMSPEYAMDGLFSVKSDVFSFGVLVLEIVTGKKNRGFYFQNNQRNLLGHAWKLWREGRASELLDPAVGESFSPCEVMRCIQVGLLCVQEQAEDRPNMATVVLMLGSETATMPQPKHPGFCLGRRPVDEYSETIYEETFTVNQVTITMLDPR
ncbi:unnamed protein product [Withania somnifera]